MAGRPVPQLPAVESTVLDEASLERLANLHGPFFIGHSLISREKVYGKNFTSFNAVLKWIEGQVKDNPDCCLLVDCAPYVVQPKHQPLIDYLVPLLAASIHAKNLGVVVNVNNESKSTTVE